MTGKNERDASDCLTVSPRTQEDACYQMLNSTYKFYLALENSVCQDYVTEKFYKILQYNVIPGSDKISLFPPPNKCKIKSVSLSPYHSSGLG